MRTWMVRRRRKKKKKKKKCHQRADQAEDWGMKKNLKLSRLLEGKVKDRMRDLSQRRRRIHQWMMGFQKLKMVFQRVKMGFQKGFQRGWKGFQGFQQLGVKMVWQVSRNQMSLQQKKRFLDLDPRWNQEERK